ncbi:ExbD/TolR family protein [Methylophilus medardicus]|uniref:Biopolymer transporter ExbD n=1 Tax=Methylophilus medardicus TaxID=2588534 RepID=A0A5B8CQS4_9PROT|nr:biopolymer transporter ExbD [Methylophilus medardicus]QDC43577.1 biopolymer transporter ExbD [Methylophilus medardicus]QDC48584.1 biopolymer transporter ExbD [Methylophilus medardicus]QDC52289.1 biopolymer transporter ExbD [Methylophilus medardicus]
MAMFTESDEALASEINVTPLVDVMLVLLTVFIVTAPLLMNAVNVKLPEASAQVALTAPKTAHISVTDAGQIMLDQQVLALEKLTPALGLLKQDHDPAVEIYADEHAQYGMVAKVLAAIQRAGITKFSFVMSPESGK